MLEELRNAKKKYEEAQQRGAGLNNARETYRNLLQTYAGDLLALAEVNAKLTAENKDLKESNDMLEDAIAEQDKELDMLKKAAGTPRGKKKAVAADE